jgi:hypothetical protein
MEIGIYAAFVLLVLFVCARVTLRIYFPSDT